MRKWGDISLPENRITLAVHRGQSLQYLDVPIDMNMLASADAFQRALYAPMCALLHAHKRKP